MATGSSTYKNALQASAVSVTPAGDVAATDVQAAVAELAAEKARLAGAVDIEITATAAGLILTTPNGTRKRIKCANDGTLSTETVA